MLILINICKNNLIKFIEFLKIMDLKAITIASNFTIIFSSLFLSKYKNALSFKVNQTYYAREAAAIKWLPSIAKAFG